MTEQSEQRGKTPRTTLGKLYTMLLPRERRNMWILLGAVIIMAGFQTAGVGAISPFMSVAANPESIETNELLSTLYELGGFSSARGFLIALGVGVIAVMVVGNGFTAFTMYWLYRYVQMRNYSLSHRLYRQYLYQPYSYFLKVNTGTLSKNILSEVQQVINGLMRPLAEAVAKGAVVLALVGFLFVTDPTIAVVATGVLTFGYGGVIFALKPIQLRMGVRRREYNRERFQAAGEGFGAVKDVKIRGTEANFEQQYAAAAKKFSWAQAMNQILSNVPKFILEGIAFALIVLMVLVLLATEENFEAAIPLLAVYAFAGYRLMPAMQIVFKGVSQLRFNAAAVDGLYADLVDGGNRYAQVKALEAGVPASANGGEANSNPDTVGFSESIALREVSFAYESAGAPVLEDISLEIQKNTTVGFVGPTGCGKTTLIDIILGLLEPTGGQLLVDGRQVPENRKRQWQRSFGYVPQEIYLSDQSVRRNIAFGIPESRVSDERLEQASRIANVHEFIVNELQDGYDTKVGERGVRLSGGQRQRIGIARALYHDPEILVMDEATSALDSVTEEAVMDAIHALMHSKTICLIAHRITTVQECDRIYMLERGRVAAEGDYEALVRNNPRFRAMAKVEG